MDTLQVIEFSKYIQPVVEPQISKKWVLNGDNNSFFKYIKECYDGSPTNAGIINGYVNYVYGDGLVDLSGKDINRYIKKQDARLICQDYKTYGAYALQVIWNSAKNPEDKKPILMKYIPVFKLGLNLDSAQNINGFWYSFDWEKTGTYKPIFIPIYDGRYKEKDIEILYVQRPSSNPFFANPDYISGLQYAQLEMELANSSVNHILNGFQGTKVVNCFGGVPETEEQRQEYQRKIVQKLTGSTNTNKVIVSFNENPEHKIVVDDIAVPELNQQYVHFEEVAEKKLIIAHSAPPVLFSGTKDGNGLSNNADEIEMATAMLYRKHISPMREVILDGLETVFKEIDDTIKPAFKDFETFSQDKREEVAQ